jgi:hypothetical protein
MRQILIILLILNSGGGKFEKLFLSIKSSENISYGYTPGNPIKIGYYSDWQKNTEAALFFISKLKKDGHPLRVTMHASFLRPQNLQKNNNIPLRYGRDNSHDLIIDCYELIVKGTADTTIIKLYFDAVLKDELYVPDGLEFDKDQNNNVYQ